MSLSAVAPFEPVAASVSRPLALGSSRALRIAFVALVLAVTVGQRLALNVAVFPVNLAFMVIYALLAIAVFFDRLLVCTPRFLLYAAMLALAGASTVVNLSVNPDQVSLGSLALLLVIYLPYVFVLKPGTLAQNDRDFALRTFLNVGFACALIGITQFFTQFVIRPRWLFDFLPYVPNVLHGSERYNTVIPVGTFSWFKSNGFFFREPSGFSLLVALTLICEWVSWRRTWRMVALGLALLLTYSGTGILALAIGMLFPLGVKTVLRFSVVGGVAGLIFLLLGDALHLGFTVSRVGEFQGERSSAYIRFIAPIRLIRETLNEGAWTALLGHGPGAISRERQAYEFHDPTWAKLLFEYGVVGFGLMVTLLWITLRRSTLPIQVRAVLFCSWLIMGGQLLAPEHNCMILALAGLPFMFAPKRVPHGR
jgi:hypothetical protein